MIESTVLQQYSLFDGLDPDQMNEILPFLEEEVYEAGQEIIAEGAQNYKIYFILEGRVAAVRGGIILNELEAGAFFGEMEVLDVNPSVAAIKTMTETKFLILSIDGLCKIFDTDLKTYSFIMMNLARNLSRKVRVLDKILTKESPLMEWN